MAVQTPIRTVTFVITGAALLALVVAVTFWVSARQADDQRWVTHSLEVQNRIAQLFSHVQGAESSQRGYLLSGDDAFAQQVAEASNRIQPELEGLAGAVADNPAQLAAVQRLRDLVKARLDYIASVVAEHKAGDTAAVLNSLHGHRGVQMMDAIRAEIGGMHDEETHLFAARTAAAAQTQVWLQAGLIAAFALIVAVGAFALRDSRQRLREAATARDRLAGLNNQLLNEAASREAAEAQLRQIHKMESIGQLTGGIAHDFNNMLAIIIGSLDMARRRLRSDPDRAEKAIVNAGEGAQRAASLTARLLAFSRQLPLAPNPVETNRLVASTSELLRRTLGEHIQLETVLAGGLWKTYADAPQLESALVNLCANARDAMPDGGRLTIETANAYLDDSYVKHNPEAAAGQYVMISVTDTGQGMPTDVMARAFDPFYTTKGVGKGTGLGLSQVYGFIKQTGGHVKIYSEMGQGTTVKIYLKRWTGADAGSAEMPAQHAVGGDEIILVVEDEPNVRIVSVDTLRELGYTVIHASGGEEALERLQTLPRVDLLFTDIVMPGMNGRRLADEARVTRPDLKVLYTTGYTRNAVVHNGMLDQGVALLTKPFTTEQLAAKVRQVIDGGGANRTV